MRRPFVRRSLYEAVCHERDRLASLLQRTITLMQGEADRRVQVVSDARMADAAAFREQHANDVERAERAEAGETRWAEGWTSAQARETETRAELHAERARVDGLITKLDEARAELARLAVIMATPAPIVTTSNTQPEFAEFPPAVAAALAVVCAGLPRDLQRQQYARAKALLDVDKKQPDEVARLIHAGTVIREFEDMPWVDR